MAVIDAFQHEKRCRRAIVRLSDISSYFCSPYVCVRGCPELVIYVRWAIVYVLTTMTSMAKIWFVKYGQAPDGVLRGCLIHFLLLLPLFVGVLCLVFV